MTTESESHPLRILLVSAERAPLMRRRTLSTVAFPLATALRILGHDAQVSTPRCGRAAPGSRESDPFLGPFSVPMGHRSQMATIHRVIVGDDLPVYTIDNPRYSSGNSNHTHIDDAEQAIFHCRATMEMLKRPECLWRPDIIHCHDWQAAIIPNWLATIYRDDPFFSQTGTVFTIHQLSDQGIFGFRVLELAGLAEAGFLYHPELVGLNELVDLTGRGICYADAVTTTSVRYAQEIQTPEFGEHLDPLLRERSSSVFGILSGIETAQHDPANDPFIAQSYDARTLERRVANKIALQRMAGLAEDAGAPLIGLVAQLSNTSGFDLIAQNLEPLMTSLDVQLLVLGTGDQEYRDLLTRYATRFPSRVRLHVTHSLAMERLVYAGSDMLLMPACVEPCARHQMVAMRYGSVPVVRATGGLADSVRNYDPTRRKGNGFSFERYDAMALYTTIVRAVEVYSHPDLWRPLQVRCMTRDFSWTTAAAKYVTVFRWALAHRGDADQRPNLGLL